MSTEVQIKIKEIIASDTVVIFMKGNRAEPQCGFSATVVGILDNYLPDYATVDVLADPEIRQGIKEFSSWPTVPQIYVKGEFIGGCDILKELEKNGELAKIFGIELPTKINPIITISDEAKTALQDAMVDAGEGEVFRLKISPQFEHSLSFDTGNSTDIVVSANGVKIYLDPWTAVRADGLKLSYKVNKMERGFEIDNPNAPRTVQEMSPHELAHRLADKDGLILIDVRTQEEWDEGHIKQARLFLAMTALEKDALKVNDEIAFICRSGGRSTKAAKEFLARGFKSVFNISGGMTAWNAHEIHHKH